MIIAERHFSQTDNPAEIKPASGIADELLSQQQNVIIINEHSKLMIPSETLKRIKGLGVEKQQYVEKLLAHALQDASKVIIIPKE